MLPSNPPNPPPFWSLRAKAGGTTLLSPTGRTQSWSQRSAGEAASATPLLETQCRCPAEWCFCATQQPPSPGETLARKARRAGEETAGGGREGGLVGWKPPEGRSRSAPLSLCEVLLSGPVVLARPGGSPAAAPRNFATGPNFLLPRPPLQWPWAGPAASAPLPLKAPGWLARPAAGSSGPRGRQRPTPWSASSWSGAGGEMVLAKCRGGELHLQHGPVPASMCPPPRGVAKARTLGAKS